MTTPPLSPAETVEAGELLAGLTPLEMDQYAGLTPLERVAAATHPHISMCRLGDTRMDCITCAEELHQIRKYIAAVLHAERCKIYDRLDAEAIDAEHRTTNVIVSAGVASALREAALIALNVDAYNHAYPLESGEARAKFPAIAAAHYEQAAPRHAAPDDGIGDDGAPVAAAVDQEGAQR